MSSSAAKVYVQIESEAEQQEHLKQQRRTLKPIQANCTDKENLTGRDSIVDQLSRLKAVANSAQKYGKRKCVDTSASVQPPQRQDANTQTEKEAAVGGADRPITAADLTSDAEPGENYYKCLAEQRRVVLEETLVENRHLYERVEGLEQEMDTLRKELDETKNLVEILKEIVDEGGDGDDKGEGNDETSSDSEAAGQE